MARVDIDAEGREAARETPSRIKNTIWREAANWQKRFPVAIRGWAWHCPQRMGVETWRKSRLMARVRSRGGGLERALARALDVAGLPTFPPLRWLNSPALPGSPDVAFPAARVAVFADGCFWHGCPEHYREPRTRPNYWRAKLERNRARDAADSAELELRLGWSVVRLWEHEILADPVGCASLVMAAMTRGRQTHGAWWADA